MTVKLAGTLPDGERNGLTQITADLVTAPTQLHVVVAVVDCKRITTDLDTGDVVPTARVRRVEVVLDADKPAVLRLLRRSHEERTGQAVLPLDLEDELREALGDHQDGE